MELLADVIADNFEIENEKVRIDSFMVSFSCRNLSRVVPVYTVNYQGNHIITCFLKIVRSILKKVIKIKLSIRRKTSKQKANWNILIKQSKVFYEVGLEDGKEVTKTEEFQLLKRMLGEQNNYCKWTE